MDFFDSKKKLESYSPDKEVEISISISYDETKMFLDVVYKGKFSIQKSYENNYIGLEQLAEAKKQFSTASSIKEYFGL